MGELNAARHIAKTPKANANSWCEMKKVLPLLAKEQHYKYLKSGKGRGGEAVIMIENVRMHADIANRHERPDHLSKRVKKNDNGRPQPPVTERPRTGIHRSYAVIRSLPPR